MKKGIKTILIVLGVIGGITMLYAFGYLEGKESVIKGVQLESIGDSIRFVYKNNTEGIWKPVYHNDGSFIGFVIYEINGTFKTFIHINETIKAKLC